MHLENQYKYFLQKPLCTKRYEQFDNRHRRAYLYQHRIQSRVYEFFYIDCHKKYVEETPWNFNKQIYLHKMNFITAVINNGLVKHNSEIYHNFDDPKIL